MPAASVRLVALRQANTRQLPPRERERERLWFEEKNDGNVLVFGSGLCTERT